MTKTFTPPRIQVIPPISVSDTARGPATQQENPWGWKLMRYFPSHFRGVNVWRMNDGTYWMSDPVDGVAFVGTIGWPYPDTTAPVNNAISSSWYPGGLGGVGGSGPGGDIQVVTPGIAIEYLGGHSWTVSTVEAANLVAVGLGAYVA